MQANFYSRCLKKNTPLFCVVEVKTVSFGGVRMSHGRRIDNSAEL